MRNVIYIYIPVYDFIVKNIEDNPFVQLFLNKT